MKNLAEAYPSDLRIAHLENNWYIYGEGLPRPTLAMFPPAPPQHLSPPRARSPPPRELPEPSLHASPQVPAELPELPELPAVTQSSPSIQRSLHPSYVPSPARRTSDLEWELQNQELYWAEKSRPLECLDNVQPERPRRLRRAGSARPRRKDRKYKRLNKVYSKYNTKSPYARSTFCQQVRAMEHQKYTPGHTKKATKRKWPPVQKLIDSQAGTLQPFRSPFRPRRL